MGKRGQCPSPAGSIERLGHEPRHRRGGDLSERIGLLSDRGASLGRRFIEKCKSSLVGQGFSLALLYICALDLVGASN